MWFRLPLVTSDSGIGFGVGRGVLYQMKGVGNWGIGSLGIGDEKIPRFGLRGRLVAAKTI